MKLWLISQDVNDGYDTFDSAVVAAKNADQARRVHPYGYVWVQDKGWTNQETGGEAGYTGGVWATPDCVKAKHIGTALKGTEPNTVICASFNAG